VKVRRNINCQPVVPEEQSAWTKRRKASLAFKDGERTESKSFQKAGLFNNDPRYRMVIVIIIYNT
jgi:hypothetical protein